MAAPIGNNNAGKMKPFQAALKRAIARRDGDNNKGATLLSLANQLIDLANNGEQWAFQELMNRLDGKPAQQQVLTGEEGGPIRLVMQWDDD